MKAVALLLDVRDMPDVVENINAILNNSGIVEIKAEKTGVAVVEIVMVEKVRLFKNKTRYDTLPTGNK